MEDNHRIFLQRFMSQGLLNAKEVKTLFKQCCEVYEENAKPSLADFVGLINNHIHPIHMEIRKALSEEDGSNHYGLVNVSRTEITKMASDYTQNELEFFKKLVEVIVESDDGSVGSIEALNLTEKLEKKISKNDAQDLLDRMMVEMWILQKEGRVSLDTRAILELEQYILEYFSGVVKICNLCNKIALKGQTCEECGIKIHHHCATRYFTNKDSRKCPVRECAAPWIHEIAKKADVESSQATQNETQSTGTRKRKHHS